MRQRVAGLAFGVDDHHVGLDLRQLVPQEHVGRQHRHDVVAGLQQADAPAASKKYAIQAGLLTPAADNAA